MAGTVVQAKAVAVNTGDASVNPAFDVAPASGNTVILCVGSDDYDTGNATDNGVAMTMSTGCAQETFMGCYLWHRVSSGGNAFEYNIGSASPSCWILLEVDGLDSSPYDTSNGQFVQASSENITTPSITPSAGERWLLTLVGFTRSANFTAAPNGISSYLNSFNEIAEISTVLGSGTRDQIGVADRSVTANGSTSYSSGATSDGAGVATSRVGIIIAFKVAASGPISVNANRVTTSQTARTLSTSKSSVINRVTTAQTPRTVTGSKTATINRVTASETARAVTKIDPIHATAGRVTTSQTARPLSRTKTVAVVRVSVTSSARAASRQKTTSLARVSTAQTARALARAKVYLLSRVATAQTARAVSAEGDIVANLNRVTSTHIARTFTAAKTKALARTVTTETTRALTRTKAVTLARVAATEAVRSVSARKMVTLVRVGDSAIARSVSTGSGPASAPEVWGVEMGLM